MGLLKPRCGSSEAYRNERFIIDFWQHKQAERGEGGFKTSFSLLSCVIELAKHYLCDLIMKLSARVTRSFKNNIFKEIS